MLLGIQEDFLDEFLIFFRKEWLKPIFEKKNKKIARKAPEL